MLGSKKGVQAVTDPGFPRGGGANSPGWAPTCDFAKISQKLHEIERIWTPKFYYVDPPLTRPSIVILLWRHYFIFILFLT